MKGFIATAQFEDTIYYYAESDTPEKALDDFISGGEFKEHCESIESYIDEKIEVCTYKAIYKGSSGWDEDLFDEEWEFALGEKVDSQLIPAAL
jgi:hypothetical protein